MEGDSGHITFGGFSLFFFFFFFLFFLFVSFVFFFLSSFLLLLLAGSLLHFFLFSSPVRSSIPLSLDHFLFFFHQVFFLSWSTAPLWRSPSAHSLYQPLLTIPLIDRCSTSGCDRGNVHFFTATSNTIEGTGGKKEETNKHLGLTQVQKESYVTPCACAD